MGGVEQSCAQESYGNHSPLYNSKGLEGHEAPSAEAARVKATGAGSFGEERTCTGHEAPNRPEGRAFCIEIRVILMSHTISGLAEVLGVC